MALLQPRLNLKVAQRQILTPGLMQMVSVLALNKLELREMINNEITENPILEEVEENLPLLDDIAREEEHRDLPQETASTEPTTEKADPFDEIDFGSYFQDYLDPGFRSPNSFELTETPSIENFLAKPSTLTDHLSWQLGSISLSAAVRDAAEYIIGNLDEDGYLPATDEELLEGYLREQLAPERDEAEAEASGSNAVRDQLASRTSALDALPPAMVQRARAHLEQALRVVQGLDPVGVAARDLRECLLLQIDAQCREFSQIYSRRPEPLPEQPAATPGLSGRGQPLLDGERKNGNGDHGEDAASTAATETAVAEALLDEEAPLAIAAVADGRLDSFNVARLIVDRHLPLMQRRDLRELCRATGRGSEETQRAADFIRTLDPRPGQRYNRSEARLIEPDVAFVKRGDEYVVVMNEDDMPTLRLNQGYRKLLTREGAEKDVRDYVKERYRSALQLMRNIEQRKNTILRTCESIIRRQTDFLENGVEAMRPMMIKEVAEEIGVHPSTVSRAVANKYVHTPQGVFELRFFFSEGVNGPEGSSTPLMLLKRKVKKLIEDEDPRKPLTDDLIAQMLQASGIDVTRRTVAKYREDLRIPSTHQRRVRG